MRQEPVIGPKVYSEEWWKARQFCFGASEAAAICGLSRWQQPLSVYESKRNYAKFNNPSTEAQRRGHRFEPVILEWYTEMREGHIHLPPMLIHPKHDFMSASPDALWTKEKAGNLPWSYSFDYIPVDAKTTSHSGEFGESGTDDIPQEYVMQAQQQIAVTDAPYCEFPVLFPGYDLKIYKVDRSDTLINLIIEAESEMLERIRNEDPPEPNWQHPKTYELIRAVHGVSGKTVQMSDFSTNLWEENELLGKQISELKKKQDFNKAKILHEMGDAGVGVMTDGRQLVRKVVKREARNVKASEYTSLRCKKNF